jgi:hypothetical protein
MPHQETFLRSSVAGRTIEVIKTYDGKYAREALSRMDSVALDYLAASMDLTSNFEKNDIPERSDDDYAEFLWEAMVEAAREDGNLFSYFVVTESKSAIEIDLFVSPDWPTAEAYVKLIGSSEFAIETH